jgi:hypothetical protein
VLAFAALAVVALATATGWWPQDESGGNGAGLVAVRATTGERGAGGPARRALAATGSRWIGRPVVVSLQDVAAIRPVEGC